MLNKVRYRGWRLCVLNVVWLHPLAAPTSIVACGPRRISDTISTTYETDMLEPLAMGKWTLKAEVSDDTSTSRSSGRIGVSAPRGTSSAMASAPATRTTRMYQRAAGGSSRNITGIRDWGSD